ncbi:hypothetical protein EMCRGX_G007305 [Ephydatia muelleri]
MQVSGRIQRWIMTLAVYKYKTLVFKKTEEHGNADALSRLPMDGKQIEEEEEIPTELVLLFESLKDSPVDCSQVKHWTKKDPILSQVLQYILAGWPLHPPSGASQTLLSFWQRRMELSTHDGCILWGNRVVVPEKGRNYVLQELHGGHPGISRMKSLSRTFVWWPGIDKDIEMLVSKCPQCQAARPSPPVAPLQPWSWPTRPWARLHIDDAGPVEGQMLLVVIDAHSKWIEVEVGKDATAEATIQRLRIIFSRFGIPETVMTDNGPCFSSREFHDFLKNNCVTHIRSAPYHPSSNGMAERAVQTVKQGVKKMTTGTLRDKLARFLFQYRITPQTTTGVSPAKLLYGRRLRSRLDALHPNLAERVERRQQGQKAAHDTNAVERSFQEQESVYVKYYARGGRWKWVPGKITKCKGPLSFDVVLENGIVCRRHQDQLRKRAGEADDTWMGDRLSTDVAAEDPELNNGAQDEQEEDANYSVVGDEPEVDEEIDQEARPPVIVQQAPDRRYPSRNRRQPERRVTTLPGVRVVDLAVATLLGSPIGGTESLDTAIDTKTAMLKCLRERFRYITCHDAYLLLRHSLAIPKLLYLLRTSPCFLSPSLKIYDDELRATICSSFNIHLTESDPSWIQSILPVNCGGLGIRSAVQLAPSAFLASAAASSELAHMILPTNMQQTQLSYVDEALVIWSQGCQEQPLTGFAAHHQKSWDSLRLFSMADTLLKNTTDELNRARLLAASCKESGAWLNALPITSLGLRMDDTTIRISMGLRLGIPLSQQAGAVGQQAEDKKAQKYKHLSSHHFFTPVAIETSGVYGPRTADFLKELGHRLRQVSGEASSFHYLAQRLSVAIQRGNSASVMGTMDGDGEEFFV